MTHLIERLAKRRKQLNHTKDPARALQLRQEINTMQQRVLVAHSKTIKWMNESQEIEQGGFVLEPYDKE